MKDFTNKLIDGFNSIEEFCKLYKKIFIYGAGKLGEGYLKLLLSKGIRPAGFITTEGEGGKVGGIQVYPIASMKNKFTNEMGVIAAFKGAEEEYIRLQVGDVPGVLSPADDLRFYLCLEGEILPFIKEISKAKPVMKKTEKWKNILVIRLDVLGDLIMSTAFLRELKRNCPESRITLVVRNSNELLFDNFPYITNLILYEAGNLEGQENLSIDMMKVMWEKIKKFYDEKINDKYDAVFHLCPLLSGRGALEGLLLGCASETDFQIGRIFAWERDIEKKLYLYRRFKEIFSYVSFDRMPKHETACMLDMLRRCGADVKNECLELWCEIENDFYDNLTDKYKDSDIRNWIAMGVVGRLPSQCWPADRFSQICDEFWKQHNWGVIIFGGDDAKEAADAIINKAKYSKNYIINLTGKTSLKQAMTVMKQCIAYVGVNTGLMHMAAAVGLPVVEISFYVRREDGGVNSPMGPWGNKSIILQKWGMDGCVEICSKPYPHCIKQVTVQEVMEAANKLLVSG